MARAAVKEKSASNGNGKVVSVVSVKAGKSYWKGTLSLGLLNVPIELTKASREPTKIEMNRHHAVCMGRVRSAPVIGEDAAKYVDHAGWCDVCGDPVRKDQVVPGYKGRVVDESVLENLPVGTKKVLDLDGIVDAKDIEPIHYEEPYWIIPQSGGEQAYTLLARSLEAERKVAVGKVTFGKREQVLVIRPLDGGLVMQTMRYPADLIPVPAFVVQTAEGVKVTPEMMKLGKMLLETYAKEWDPASYVDEYGKVLREYMDALERGEATAPAALAERQSTAPVDLMATLKASIEAKTKAPKPAKKAS